MRLALVGLAALLLLGGCGDSEGSLREQVKAAADEAAAAHARAEELEQKVEDLESRVADLENAKDD